TMRADVIEAEHYFQAKTYLQNAFPDKTYEELKTRIMALAKQIKERKDANDLGPSHHLDFETIYGLGHSDPRFDPIP
ncbi:MAG: hypothetical protein KDH96_08275, partial [Candidatus Riesia sp.]|nr:hypothetical protein [Candidatus Riesia sp.]